MSRIIKLEDLFSVRSAWMRVFASNDPFSWPFQASLVAGRVFYPTDGYHLTKAQYCAVRRALETVGESQFFLSIVESEEDSFLKRDWGHWSCNSPSYEEYSALPLTLENAFYSAQGRWGILVSHEMHAMIGCGPDFKAALDEGLGDLDLDLRLLREAWSSSPSAGWLDSVIVRLRSGD